MKINIIGAGNLGKILGYLIFSKQLATITGIINQTTSSTQRAIEFIGQGSSYTCIEDLPGADITFITTPDDIIAKVGERLWVNSNLKPKTIIVHCSGALTSDVLTQLRQKGCYIASVHPMESFLADKENIKNYAGTYCAMEGDIQAIKAIKLLFEKIGFITYLIDKDKKSLYHIAGVFASNYLVTLAHLAQICLTEAKIEQAIAIDMITHLMQTTVNHLKSTHSPKKSLTGPIKRGDSLTIAHHLQSLSNMAQPRALYKRLAQVTLSFSELTSDKKKQIMTVLNDKS